MYIFVQLDFIGLECEKAASVLEAKDHCLTHAIFFMGFAVGSILLSWISNRLGRRFVIIVASWFIVIGKGIQ